MSTSQGRKTKRTAKKTAKRTKKKDAAKAKQSPPTKVGAVGHMEPPAFDLDVDIYEQLTEDFDHMFDDLVNLSKELSVPIPGNITQDMRAALVEQKSEVSGQRAHLRGLIQGITVTLRRARLITSEQYAELRAREQTARQGGARGPMAAPSSTSGQHPDRNEGRSANGAG